MQPLTGAAILHVITRSEPAWLDRIVHWYDTEHLHERVAMPRFLSARRFVDIKDPVRSLAVYELEDPGALETPAYLESRTNPDPRSAEIASHFTSERGIYQQFYPETGAIVHGGAQAAGPSTGGAILNVFAAIEPGWEDEVNRWYVEEHIPQLLAIEGFLSARRYQAVQDIYAQVTLYDLAHPDSLQTDAFKQGTKQVSAWTTRLQPHVTFHSGIFRQAHPARGFYTVPPDQRRRE